MRLNKIFTDYLKKRNKKIIKLRKRGKPIKLIADKFNISERHINRIIKDYNKEVKKR